MTLLERRETLDRLHELLGQVRSEHGRVLFIGGEAGIGKTALIRQFTAEVARSARLLQGACDPLSTPRPLGPLYDIAESTGGELALALANPVDRATLFSAALAMLSAAGKVNVAVIEDAHWADEATLDLLRFLGRRIERTRALLLVTYRDDELGPDHPLRRLLGDLATAPGVGRATLRPLSAAAVTELATGSRIDGAALHQLTRGNAFFVTEVLAAEGGLPPTIRDAVLTRAAGLSATARELLETAAIVGPPIDPAILMQVNQSGLAEIDECLHAGMLQADGRGLTFRHELGRQSVLDSISGPRRIDLHRRVLHVLTLAPPEQQELTRLAHHAEEAGDRESVLRYATTAAESAARLRAHREAAAQYARVLRFAEGLPDDRRRQLLWSHYVECSIAGHVRDGIETLNALLEIARRTSDHLREAEWLARLSASLVLEGRNSEAEEALHHAAEIVSRYPEGPSHTLVFRIQSQTRMLNRDTTEAVLFGKRALALAERFGDTENVIASLNCVGSALLVDGNVEEGRNTLERSLAIATEHGHDQQVMNALVNLGSGHGEIYCFDDAQRYLETSITYADQHDMSPDYSRSWLALVQCYRGHWNEAADLALQVLRREGSPAIGRIMALVALGRVRSRRGDPESGVALDDALRLAGPTATLQRLGPVHAARSEAAWLAGNPTETAAEAKCAYELALAHNHAWFTGELAYWLWKADGLNAIPATIAEPFARQISGDWEQAAQLWDRLGCPYEAARTRSESDEIAQLSAALAEFERLGARPAAASVARRLRDLGVRGVHRGPRQSTQSHPARLTRREAECLELLGQGCRNAEIAERLFLSPKTVERHLVALFAKLGVHSRMEAIIEAGRLGLLRHAEGRVDQN